MKATVTQMQMFSRRSELSSNGMLGSQESVMVANKNDESGLILEDFNREPLTPIGMTTITDF